MLSLAALVVFALAARASYRYWGYEDYAITSTHDNGRPVYLLSERKVVPWLSGERFLRSEVNRESYQKRMKTRTGKKITGDLGVTTTYFLASD